MLGVCWRSSLLAVTLWTGSVKTTEIPLKHSSSPTPLPPPPFKEPGSSASALHSVAHTRLWWGTGRLYTMPVALWTVQAVVGNWPSSQGACRTVDSRPCWGTGRLHTVPVALWTAGRGGELAVFTLCLSRCGQSRTEQPEQPATPPHWLPPLLSSP